MRLFQRLRTPFADDAGDQAPPAYGRLYGVGELLRDRREELGLDLDEVGESLRIKAIYLAALEQGRAQDLPGPTYAIGFIRAYAQYLGFDSDRVLERYKAETTEIHARPDLALPVPLGTRSLPGGPILLVGLILALCGYGTWYYLSTGERSRPQRVAPVPAELRASLPPPATAAPGAAAAPSAAGDGARLGTGLASPVNPVPPATDATAATATGPASTAPGSTAPSTPAPSGTALAPAGDSGDGATAGQIDIRALADCWIQVRSADQTIVFSRVLKAGETYRVPRAGLYLRTGNAGALAVAVDGKPAPAIGGIGTLRRNVALDPQALLAGTAVKG